MVIVFFFLNPIIILRAGMLLGIWLRAGILLGIWLPLGLKGLFDLKSDTFTMF